MIETLGEAYQAGWQVSARCAHGLVDHTHATRKCLWTHELDMVTLVATRGRDFPIARLAERLRCPRCGSREIRVLYLTPGTRNGQAAGVATRPRL